ncbi:MAG TPA: hypothetical protein VG537_00680 [Candidatus Kapabacteria bacterium]|nr:hypothetical protein [Candidatus Kapabacteria bacterium]
MSHRIIRFAFLIVVVSLVLGNHSNVRAQGPQGKSFGFGIILPDPLGGTLKIWTNPVNAVVFDLGEWENVLRLQFDYLWQFDAFRSRIVKMYAGPGLGVTLDENTAGVGIRGVFGIDVYPIATPLELFFELGPFLLLTPDFNGFFDVGLGLRFYP